MPRTLIVLSTCFLLGLPPAAFPSFLLNQDWVWGMALLLSGFWVILAARKYGVEKLRQENINPGADIKMGRWWSFILRYISPLIFLIMIVWWFAQAISWDKKTWWHPLKTNSAGTILFQ